MNKTFIAALFLLTIRGAFAQEKITLQEAVQRTLSNNLQIKQAALGEALSSETLKQSKYSLLPSLNASTGLNFNFGRSVDPTSYTFVNNEVTNSNGSLSSNVTLYQGGQKINQIAQNKFQLEADKSYTRKIRNDLTLQVVTTYLLVLNNTDLVNASQQQLDISNQQLDRVQKLFDVGNNTLADLSLAKSQVATAELNLTNSRNQLDISYLNLAQLMERDPGSPFEVVAPQVNGIGQINKSSAAEIFNSAQANYPDIRLAENNRKVSELGVAIARGGYYPRLTLGASIGTGYSNQRPFPFNDQIDQNLNQSIGFSLSIPLFNGYSARSGVKRSKISLENASISEQLQKNTLNKTISQAVLDLRAAEKSYASAESAYNSSKDAFNVTQKRYTVGLVNALEFNQAQTNLNSAEFNVIQAKYNLIFRNKVIDYYLGTPLTF
jgi:outer membrane protein